MFGMGLGLGDLMFLLDLAAFITLYFIAKGVTVEGVTHSVKSSGRPFFVTFLAVILSVAFYAGFPPLGVAMFMASVVGLYIYFTLWAEEILGYFEYKPFLFVAALPLAGSFIGGILIFLSVLLGAIPLIPLLLTVLGLYILFLSKGLLIALIAWVLERANLSRYWTFLLGLLGYVGLLIAVLIAKQRGRF